MRSLTKLLTALFPPICCNCQTAGSILCTQCFQKIDFFTGEITDLQNSNGLDAVLALAYFQPPISTLIQQLKYSGMFANAQTIASLIYRNGKLPHADLLIPVPLHPGRLRIRGYNQSSLIATELGRLSHVPACEALRKTTATASQVSVQSRDHRLHNLDNSFAINKTVGETLAGKKCILIDDVVTTGATLATCATLLKQAGARTVFGVTAAHE